MTNLELNEFLRDKRKQTADDCRKIEALMNYNEDLKVRADAAFLYPAFIMVWHLWSFVQDKYQKEHFGDPS